MPTYARLDNGYPYTSLDLTDKEWETLYFETYTLDHDNKYDFPEECYNMMLVHPLTGQVFWGYSADFDWGERPLELIEQINSGAKMDKQTTEQNMLQDFERELQSLMNLYEAKGLDQIDAITKGLDFFTFLSLNHFENMEDGLRLININVEKSITVYKNLEDFTKLMNQ